MRADLIGKKYKSYRSKIENVIDGSLKVTDELELSLIHDELEALRLSFHSPFMFVVIGEVKSGKSSFVNALTGESICDVDADICTDKVQQLVYSETPFIEHKEPYFDLKGINAEILKEISIVDTPGTDSIIAEHEEITRKFAPNSNLIFFVFPMMNPHHSSSWEMLKIMNDQWSRNIVFIAAQADRCSEHEIKTNTKKIFDYAVERGILDPHIFVTSSKFEHDGDTIASGFNEVRDFISDTTRGGRHLILKLNDRVDLAKIIHTKIDQLINKRKTLLTEDKLLRGNITIKYDSGKENSIKEIEKILKRMTFVFERTSGEFISKLRKALSPGNIFKQALPIPRFRNNKKIDRAFLEDLISQMNINLEKQLSLEASDNAAFFVDGIKYRFSEIIREVNKARDHQKSLDGEQALEVFTSKREEILKELLTGLTELAEDESLIPALEKHNPQISDTVLKGGAIAAAGALLALIAQGAVFDATGGILSALGLLGASGVIFFKRTFLIKEFKKRIKESNSKFHREFKERFEKKLQFIFSDIERLFENLDKHISLESEKITQSEVQFNESKLQLLKIGEEIKKL